MVLKGLAQLVGRCAWVLEQADKHSLTCEPLSNLRLSLRVAGSSAFLTVLRVWILVSAWVQIPDLPSIGLVNLANSFSCTVPQYLHL